MFILVLVLQTVKKTFSVQKENAPSLFSRMLVSITSEVAWMEIHVVHHGKTQNSTQKSIHSKPFPTLQALPSPLPATPCPLSLSPGIVMARYFDRECERTLLVRVTG